DHFSFEIVACLLVDRMTDVFVRPIVLATARHREEQPLTSFDDLDAFYHERILECEAERRFQLRVLTEEHPDLGDSHCRLPQVSHAWGGPILQPCEPTSRAGHGPRVLILLFPGTTIRSSGGNRSRTQKHSWQLKVARGEVRAEMKDRALESQHPSQRSGQTSSL